MTTWLDEWEEADRKRTQGEFRVHEPPVGSMYTPKILNKDGAILAEFTSYGNMCEDAEFIALNSVNVPRAVAEIRRLREALAFYADREKYVNRTAAPFYAFQVLTEGGERARQALAESEKP